jgi:glycyl-tRNA synthetase beta chain
MAGRLSGVDGMTDFLLELRSEEIPARMQDKARDDLARLFVAELGKAGIVASDLTTYATPRRLTLIARALPAETAAVSEETKGPKASAPPQALEGFLRKTGLTREQLIERDGVLFAVIERAGRATASVLAEAIPNIVRAFPWPKSMRWGDASSTTESLKWVRPLQGIVALFGEQIVACEIAGITSGAATVGHRFHHPGVITIGSASDYAEKLRACHVIVDQDERRQIIALGATMAARKAGLELIQDDGLLTENAGLTEWPVPLLGRFDAAFLDVPPEVIQLTARVNQKYFVCRDAQGNLANAFVCTANIDASDGGAKIVEGNRKVLAARLSDAKFFYDTDLKVPLDEQAKKLEKIVFHELLGPLSLKVERVAKLASWFGMLSGIGEASANDRAAMLSKADLPTSMVGEFPELQGTMGAYYAKFQGEKLEIAEAIREQYNPSGPADFIPYAPVAIALGLADRLDNLGGFFRVGMKPTGSKDPFALRRAALGIISLILSNKIRISLRDVISWQNIIYERQFGFSAGFEAYSSLYKSIRSIAEHAVADNLARKAIAASGRQDTVASTEARKSAVVAQEILNFIIDRLKVQQREAGVRHDLIDAVFATKDKNGGGEDDLVRLLARVHALQAFVGTPDGANLLAGYKRAANILKKEGVATTNLVIPAPAGISGEGAGTAPQETPAFAGVTNAGASYLPLSYTPEKDEAALITALDAAAPRAQAAVAREDFEGAMAALATLRGPIDAFFDTVTVNDPEQPKREARLELLARVRAAVHTVADFSKIEG